MQQLRRDQFDQIERIMRRAAKGAWFAQWRWAHQDGLVISSNRFRQIAVALELLEQAGYSVSPYFHFDERGDEHDAIRFKDLQAPADLADWVEQSQRPRPRLDRTAGERVGRR